VLLIRRACVRGKEREVELRDGATGQGRNEDWGTCVCILPPCLTVE
jgi:hypothetical protein